MNITIDDTSPRIQYHSKSPGSLGTWRAASSQSDPEITRYFQSTYSSTTTDGDQMVFTFNGSAIWVYGGRNVENGWYTAQMDDFAIERLTDDPPTNRQYQTVLYHREGIDTAKEHTITMTNIPSDSRRQKGLQCSLDIDYLIIQQPVTGKIYTTDMNDDVSQMTFLVEFCAESPDCKCN